MGVLIFLIFILPMLKKTKADERRSEGFKIFLFLYILFTILGGVMSEPMVLGSLGLLFVYFLSRMRKKKEERERKEHYGWDTAQDAGRYQKKESTFSKADASTARVFSVVLPGRVSKRRKLVNEFNKKFQLFLTDEQVKGIVDSTYMSETWKREVEAMTNKYESVYEWFQGNTKWLRAYLYAFHVQEVTSDFDQQERIVTTAFEEIMRYSDSLSYLSVSERIARVNSKYYTNFDDVTYMIAYRFLESKGLFHSLEVSEPVRNDSELDDLMEKYRTTPMN